MGMEHHLNTIHSTKDFGDYEVIEILEGNKRAKIRFLNTGYECDVFIDAIRKGHNFKDRLVPTVYGVGYLGYANSKDNRKLYCIWKDMIRRCYNTNFKQYNIYGGAGITVCDRWKCFEHFLEDAVNLPGYQDMINNPHIVYSLDKDILQQGIPPHMKVYSPSTCMWIPMKENCIQPNIDHITQSKVPYIGVSLTHGNTYNVRLRDKHTGKKVNAGNFDNPEVAANVYNVYSKIYGVGYQNDVPYIPFNECLQHKCFASKNTKFADMINIIEEKE